MKDKPARKRFSESREPFEWRNYSSWIIAYICFLYGQLNIYVYKYISVGSTVRPVRRLDQSEKEENWTPEMPEEGLSKPEAGPSKQIPSTSTPGPDINTIYGMTILKVVIWTPYRVDYKASLLSTLHTRNKTMAKKSHYCRPTTVYIMIMKIIKHTIYSENQKTKPNDLCFLVLGVYALSVSGQWCRKGVHKQQFGHVLHLDAAPVVHPNINIMYISSLFYNIVFPD